MSDTLKFVERLGISGIDKLKFVGHSGAYTPLQLCRNQSALMDNYDETRTATIGLEIAGREISLTVTIPPIPIRASRMLPLFQSLAESVVRFAIEDVEGEGERVSCQAGCGACCRQLVPISEIEARRLHEVIDAMSPERREEIMSRFAAARARLDSSGLLEKLLRPEQFEDGELRPVGLDYFRQQIACPFLENESCSIYVDRPVACREYLVTSPAENCRAPTAETVQCVPLAGKVSVAMSRVDENPKARFIRWVPLILALEWAGNHRDDEPAARPGDDLLREFLSRLGESKKA